jgi:hypothetical protein
LVLKFLNRPQTGRRASGAPTDDWMSRFPQGSAPIASAPEAGKFHVWDASGRGYLAERYRGGFQKLAPKKDFRSGRVWHEMAGRIDQPIAWRPIPPPRGR